MIKTVFFDWNGVVIADAHAAHEADNHVIQSFGGKPVSFTTWKKTLTIPSINYYCLHGAKREKLEKSPHFWADSFHPFYEKRVDHVRTRRGVRQLFSWLHQHNIAIAILSNHTYEGISRQLKRLSLDTCVSKIIANNTNDTVLVKQTKGDRLKQYLAKKGLKGTEAIIVGDSPEETEIGKQHGLLTIAITNGFYTTKRLRAANPDYLSSSHKKILEILKTVL